MLNRTTKRRLLGSFFGILTLVILLGLVNLFFAAVERQQRAEEERDLIVPPEALTHEVQTRNVERPRHFVARLEPWKESTLTAEVDGRVLNVQREMGQRAESGEALFQLEDTLARLRHQSAVATLEAAGEQAREFERQLEETRGLVSRRALPESEEKAARARLTIQKKEIQRLEAEVLQQEEVLRRHLASAPYDGTLRRRLVQEGDRVAPGQALAEFVDLSSLRVIFHVSEKEYDHFAPGTEISVEITAVPGQSFPAEVAHRAPSGAPGGGGFRVEARLENPNEQWAGGITGTVRAIMKRYADQPFVPAAAVRREGTEALVEVTENGSSGEWVPVTLGPLLDGYYPVHSGLELGQIILLR